MKTPEDRAEHEIFLIEQDESLTDEEKDKLIREVYCELRDLMRYGEEPNY